MKFAQTPRGALAYELIDLTSPWVSDSEVILFHHGLGMIGEMWRPWLPALIDQYRILLFDIRAHGASAHNGQATPLTLDTFCDDAMAIADAIGAKQFHFVGESLGGTVGLQLAVRSPGSLRSLTVSNAAHVGASITSTDDFEKFLAENSIESWSRRIMNGRFFDDDISPDLRYWYETQQARISKQTVLDIRTMLVKTDLSQEVSKIKTPTLLMNGDSSPFIAVEMMADLHAKIDNSRLNIFARAKHGLPVSHAKVCSRALRHFLDDLSIS